MSLPLCYDLTALGKPAYLQEFLSSVLVWVMTPVDPGKLIRVKNKKQYLGLQVGVVACGEQHSHLQYKEEYCSEEVECWADYSSLYKD